MLTKAMLTKLWPRASQSKIDAIVRTAPGVFAEHNITDPIVVAHFMAQISHECGGGTIVRENMNYSASRMMQIFGVGKHSAAVTATEAAKLAGKPEQIAERVYGLGNPKKAKELGNTSPGDGWKYRGGGDLQCTGKSSYRRASGISGVDLVGNPDLISDPSVSFKVAVDEFVALRCVDPALKDDIRTVTRRVNGGTNGIVDREAWLKKWKVALLHDADDHYDLPRGAEQIESKPLLKSKIAAASTVIGAEAATQAYGAMSSAVDHIKEIKGTAQEVGVWDIAIQAAQHHRIWITLAIIGATGLIIWWRWKDHG